MDNDVLTSLDLADNELGESGVRELANSVSTNLSSLNLGFNALQQPGAVEVAKLLRDWSCLTYLGLESNGFREEAVSEIDAALQGNRRLSSLDLRYNRLGQSGEERLRQARDAVNDARGPSDPVLEIQT